MNENRRKFLKIIFIGSGALLMEKVLGPLFSKFLDDPSAKADSMNKNSFRDFRVVEGQKGLSVYDSSGEEILQIDNRA
jgi:hypothetical protein